jgi:hypothetical protein
MLTKLFSKLAAYTISFLIITTTSLVLVESVLRLTKFKKKSTQELEIIIKDENLGWRNNSGHFTYLRYVDGKRIDETYDSFGARIAPNHRPSLDKAVLTGGSFIHGFAINDSDTLASQLNEKIEHLDFVNLGVSGFGTFQSLLLFKEYLALHPDTRLVIYGFNSHHEHRNYGVFLLRLSISLNAYSKDKAVHLPFCRLDFNNQLLCHINKTVPYVSLLSPISEFIHSINHIPLLSDVLVNQDNARVITKKLIKEFQREADLHNIKFILFILKADEHVSNEYITFGGESEITTINCQHPEQNALKYLLPDGLHPNEEVVSHWANCLAPVIENTLLKQ